MWWSNSTCYLILHFLNNFLSWTCTKNAIFWQSWNFCSPHSDFVRRSIFCLGQSMQFHDIRTRLYAPHAEEERIRDVSQFSVNSKCPTSVLHSRYRFDTQRVAQPWKRQLICRLSHVEGPRAHPHCSFSYSKKNSLATAPAALHFHVASVQKSHTEKGNGEGNARETNYIYILIILSTRYSYRLNIPANSRKQRSI